MYSWLLFLSSLYVTFNVLRCRAFTVIIFFCITCQVLQQKIEKASMTIKSCIDYRENDSEIRDLKENVMKLEMEKANGREKDLEI